MKDVIYKKVCVACGNDFETPTKTKKICGPKCTIRYHREKVLGPVEGYDYIKCNICGQKFADFGNHYKKEHPGHPVQQPSKCQKLVDSVSGENNPGYQHGGRLSPWSKKSEHHTEEQIESSKKLAKENSLKNPNNAIHSTKIEYYLDQGMTEEEAKKALSERQKTFSLDICIEKYGEVEGRKRWEDRQDKWQNTLNSKSPEEIIAINKLKVCKNGASVSNNEKEIGDYLEENGIDLERQFVIVKDSKTNYVYDFKVGNKIVEYNGDYWHANRSFYEPEYFNSKINLSAEQIWQKDKHKYDIAVSEGYEVFYIWENDYKQDKSKIMELCLKFLQS